MDLFVYNTTWMWLVRCLGPGVSFVDQSKLLDVIYSAAFFIHLISGKESTSIQSLSVNPFHVLLIDISIYMIGYE